MPWASNDGTTQVEITVLDDFEIQAAIAATLADAGVTIEELRQQAAEGRFVSESARRAWFVVSAFLP